MECITIEIDAEKAKNILLSCIYRATGSCPNIFNENMIELYDKINDRNMVFVCGDFNIDLLNPNENKIENLWT